MMGFRSLRVHATLAIALAVSAMAARGEAPSPSAALFLRVCSACHGERGDGRSLASTALKTPPRDFSTEAARTGLSREYMIAIVRDGRPHTAMVGRTERLTQAEIEGVVDFIRAAFMVPDPDSPLALGRAHYRKSCASCHGDRGHGSAAHGGMPASPPISASRARPGLTAEAMAEAISRQPHIPGSPVPGPNLSPDDVKAVVAYIRGAFIEASSGRRAASAPKDK